MLSYLKKRWNYLVAKLTGRFDENADPKVQLEQAIGEAKDQHRRLREQAANVIANQKRTEMRLSRSMDELERVNANARQAVLMAEEAAKSGDADKASEYTAAAESFANKLINVEAEVEGMKELHLQSSEAAEDAKAAVEQNSQLLQDRLAEKQKLLGQLDQAKMQETVNEAMLSINETVGGDVPSLEQVRENIEARYAKAKGTAELTESSVESNMREVEKAASNVEARARLDQIREQLGIEAASSPSAQAVEAETNAETATEST